MRTIWPASVVACMALMLGGCSTTSTADTPPANTPVKAPESKPEAPPVEKTATTLNTVPETKAPTPGAGKEGAPANPAPC